MKARWMVAIVGLGALATAGDASAQATPGGVPKATAAKAKAAEAVPIVETATFGGGCFWCIEAAFEQVKGVKSVVAGYAGGTTANPNYEQVSTGQTGHAEVVQVEYDPRVVTFDELLKIFFAAHDPTTLYRQGPDEGTQYRSIILYVNDDQRDHARKYYDKLTAARAYDSPIVTELAPLTRFTVAEAYHQNYYRMHKNSDYSAAYITPKLKALRKKFAEKPAAKVDTPK